MKLFQRGSIKKKLEDSREKFTANFYKIETLERELQFLDKISVSERVLSIIKKQHRDGDTI